MPRRLSWVLIVVLATLYGLTWLLGPAQADRLLVQLQDSMFKMSLARLTGTPLNAALLDMPLPPELAPTRFVASRRTILPLVVYSEGQSYSVKGPIGISAEPSFVLWYGASGVVLWANGDWFPARAVHAAVEASKWQRTVEGP